MSNDFSGNAFSMFNIPLPSPKTALSARFLGVLRVQKISSLNVLYVQSVSLLISLLRVRIAAVMDVCLNNS